MFLEKVLTVSQGILKVLLELRFQWKLEQPSVRSQLCSEHGYCIKVAILEENIRKRQHAQNFLYSSFTNCNAETWESFYNFFSLSHNCFSSTIEYRNSKRFLGIRFMCTYLHIFRTYKIFAPLEFLMSPCRHFIRTRDVISCGIA